MLCETIMASKVAGNWLYMPCLPSQYCCECHEGHHDAAAAPQGPTFPLGRYSLKGLPGPQFLLCGATVDADKITSHSVVIWRTHMSIHTICLFTRFEGTMPTILRVPFSGKSSQSWTHCLTWPVSKLLCICMKGRPYCNAKVYKRDIAAAQEYTFVTHGIGPC